MQDQKRCRTFWSLQNNIGQQARLLSSPPSFLSPISPLSFPSLQPLSLLSIKRSTSRHIAAYVNASWAAFHVHVPNESSTFGRDRRTDSMRRERGERGGRGEQIWQREREAAQGKLLNKFIKIIPVADVVALSGRHA